MPLYQIFLIILLSIIVLLLLIYLWEPVIIGFAYSRLITLFVRNPPYLNMEEHFPDARILRDNFLDIKKELEELMKHRQQIPKLYDLGGVAKSVSEKDGKAWRTFIIKGLGHWIPHNCELVPHTTELIARIPKISTAMFSILDGHKIIFPHRGQYKGVFRYHLGLIVPKDAPAYILVDNKKYFWTEGEDVLFDDTFVHEVHNDSENIRVVLLCDVVRNKSIPLPLRWLTRKIYFLMGNSRKAKKGYKKSEVQLVLDP